jgi:hypothetical protein
MAWKLAKSLETLRAQVNEASPNRSKASDGTIGDAAHASRSSDHNPHVVDGKTGVVTAIDITHDPAHGVDARKLAEALVASRDPRIKYIISNGQIASGAGGTKPWTWRTYSGSNPHTKHVHLSVKGTKALYDSVDPWHIALKLTPKQAAKPKAAEPPLLKRGSKGEDVKRLQRLLGIKADGIFGKGTEAAVKAFQSARKLVPDGKVGAYTWAALEKPSAKPQAAGLLGGLVTGIAVDVLKDVVGGALAKAAKDPDLPVTRDKVPELVKVVVDEVAPAVVKQIAPKVEAQVKSIEENAANAEPWYQSRVVIGTIVSLLAIGGGFLGVQIDALAQGEIVDNAIKIIGAAGALFALYGRLRAGLKPLGK